SDVPIIFLTANTTGVRHLNRGYSLGAVDYIVKPVDPDILRSKVAVFVDLFKKTQEVKQQAQLLREKNLELENANLARLKMLIDLGQELSVEHDPTRVLQKFCLSGRTIVSAQTAAAGLLDGNGKILTYYCASSENGGSDDGMPVVAERALKRLIAERRPLRLTDADEPLRNAEAP